MMRVNVFSISSVCLRADDYPGPHPCFACLYAFVPRVLESCLTSTSAVSEPGTAASATTAFPRFRDSGAFMAFCTDGRGRSFWCVLCRNWSKTETRKLYNSHQSILLHRMSLGLTFAGIRALRPPVIYVFVCSTSAVLIPSAARSAAADSAGFRECAAL